jgi:nucleotide-binding universal stress UspA family protein
MYERILVPVDGSGTSTQGLGEALRLARLTGATLKILHVVDAMSYATGFETYAAYTDELLPAMRANGQKILADAGAIAEQQGARFVCELKEVLGRRVADVVVEQANEWKADLIVIGTHGRRGANRLFLGSDAEQIARISPAPVLLVRARGSAVHPGAPREDAVAA